MSWSRLRIRFGIALLPFTVLVIVLAAVATGVVSYLIMELPSHNDVEMRMIRSAGKILTDTQALIAAIEGVPDSPPDEHRDAVMEARERLEASLFQAQQADIIPEEKNLLAAIREIIGIADQLLAQNDGEVDREDLRRAYQRLVIAAGATIVGHEGAIETRLAKTRQLGRGFALVMVLSMLVGVCLTVIIAYRLGSRVLQPIEGFIASAERLRPDNLDTPIRYPQRDEFSHLADAFNAMGMRLHEYQRELSTEVQQQKTRMSALLGHLPSPVFIFDRALEVEVTNPAADRLLEAPELGGELPSELLEMAESVAVSGIAYIPERLESAVFLHAHHDEKVFLPRVFPLSAEEPDYGLAMVLFDVTQLRLADDLRSDLIAIVSHELKTPLTSARLALHTVLEQTPDGMTEAQLELVRTARNELERQLRTIENLLDLSRLEAGQSLLSLTHCAPLDLIEEAVADWDTLAESRGVKVKIDAPADLPEVEVDPTRFRVALGCLLANALQFSDPGSFVRVGASQADDRVVFIVDDNGPGIPPELHEAIFQRFFRGPGGKLDGRGLGLAVARAVAVAHHGTIGCESERGRGSRFHIAVPITADVLDEVPPGYWS